MAATKGAYRNETLPITDSAGTKKHTLVAKYLKNTSTDKGDGYFNDADPDITKVAKIATIFHLDEVLTISHNDGSGTKNIGFIGLVQDGGENAIYHNLTKRRGAIKVTKMGKELIALNDAGLNTYADTSKPLVIWAYQGLLKFKIFAQSSFYTHTIEYGIYLRNTRTGVEIKKSIGANIPSKGSISKIIFIGEVNGINETDTIQVIPYAKNEEGEKRGLMTEFGIEGRAELLDIMKVENTSQNPSLGEKYTLLAKDFDYSRPNGLDEIFSRADSEAIDSPVQLYAIKGDVILDSEVTFTKYLPSGLYAGINREKPFTLTNILENGKPNYWTNSTYQPPVPKITAMVDLYFEIDDYYRDVIKEVTVQIRSPRLNGFNSSGSISIRSLMLVQDLNSSSPYDITIPITNNTINYVQGQFYAQIIEQVSIEYPEHIQLQNYKLRLYPTYADGMDIIGLEGVAPTPDKA